MSALPDVIALAARLRAGELVAFPTETVYGLGAMATDESAVRRVYDLKGRPAANPLIVHVSGIAMARQVAKVWPREADILAGAFWPGPLTIVVARGESIPASVAAGGGSIGVRCPDHPLALALIEAAGGPIVGPSANRSGHISPTTAAHVHAEFGDAVAVLDGGACRAGIESTVVALVDAAGEPCTARILRQGAIGARAISSVLEMPVAVEFSDTSGLLQSPGLLGRHYAPRKRAVICGAEELDRVVSTAGGRCAVLACESYGVAPPHSLILMPSEAAGYAARLYAALREADESPAELIVIVRPSAERADAEYWSAIMDRLRRATAL